MPLFFKQQGVDTCNHVCLSLPLVAEKQYDISFYVGHCSRGKVKAVSGYALIMNKRLRGQ